MGEGKNNLKFYSLPKYVEDTVSYDDAITYINLPRILGVHPTLHRNVTVELKYGQVTVGVEGYSHCATVPEEEYTLNGLTHINNLSLHCALLLLPESALVNGNSQVLGTYKNEDVTLCNGKFGPYLRCGQINCALKGVDPASLTLTEAIALLEQKAISGTSRYLKKSAASSPVAKSSKAESEPKAKKSKSAVPKKGVEITKKVASNSGRVVPKVTRAKKAEAVEAMVVSVDPEVGIQEKKKVVRKTKAKAE